jgi:EAL domain-containing protein (putative c-di-GMP-specific phosphodiesterase class I)
MEDLAARLLEKAGDRLRPYGEMGARFEPQVCVIRCPEDLNTAEDILSLGHIFHRLGDPRQDVFLAGEIVRSKSFTIEAHIGEILDRALRNGHIQMYYQPIYDVRSGGFHSAEALARITDPEFGLISPSAFIPAAETMGLIIPLGERIMDQVFRFVSEHDLNEMGLGYIEMNLSVAQCMQASLPETIGALQRKYGVDPSQINLEITETTFENISEVMLENVNQLISMGYSFALDDYGIGYSSIQRVNHLPLQLIKIDKSMLDEIGSRNGRMILEHTVRMMQSIDKLLVAEGAETLDEVEALERMDCDYIQGFYFSHPLPEAEFLRFIEDHNGRRPA